MQVAVLWPMGARDQAGLGQFLVRGFEVLGHSCYADAIVEHDPWSIEGRLRSHPRLEATYLRDRVAVIRRNLLRRDVGLVVVVKGIDLGEELISQLRPRRSVPVVSFMPDSPLHLIHPRLNQLAIQSLLSFDLVVTFAKMFLPVYEQMGVSHVVRIPFGYDPQMHRPVKLEGADVGVFGSDLSYAGNTGPLQRRWMDSLAGYRPKCFGADWDNAPRLERALRRFRGYERYRKSLRGFGAELTKVCAGAKVMLNLVRAEHDCGHSMKTFELPACGACVVTNRTDEQEEFFQDGARFFRNQDELIEHVERLLGDEKEREKLRNAGLKEVARHTYESRAVALLQHLGLD